MISPLIMAHILITVVFIVIEELQCHAVSEQRVFALSIVDANSNLDADADCGGYGN